MTLKADLDELTEYWGRAPWRVKVVLGLSVFLSTSSLASLADAVFQWKGFVLEAIAFYREYVAVPFATLLGGLSGLTFTPQWIDSGVLFGIFLGALARSTPLRHATKAARRIDYCCFAASYLTMMTLLFFDSPSSSQSSVWVLYPVFLLNAYLLTKGAARLLTVSHMLAPVLVTGVLAAVNNGLTR